VGKAKPFIIGFVSGIVLFGIITLWINSSKNILIADLRAAEWSLESASRTNTELTKGIRELSGQLANTNKIIAEQQSIINNQQRIIIRQKQIIGDIIIQISGEGVSIRDKIRSIAEGFGLLYKIYN
jgi:hypothetical protein